MEKVSMKCVTEWDQIKIVNKASTAITIQALSHGRCLITIFCIICTS